MTLDGLYLTVEYELVAMVGSQLLIAMTLGGKVVMLLVETD